MADPEIVGGGDVVESGRPKAARGGEGYTLPTGKGSGEGAVPPPQKFFLILDLKMVSFGALWVPVGGCIPLILPLDPPLDTNKHGR